MYSPLNITANIYASTQLKYQKIRHRRIGCVLIGCLQPQKYTFKSRAKNSVHRLCWVRVAVQKLTHVRNYEDVEMYI